VTDLPVTIADVKKAEKAIAGALTRTPLVRAAALCELAGCEAYLKL
jgi:threonine dehydratase